MLKTAVRVNDTGRPIKIGCDPEFELLDEGGRHVDAGNYYQMRGQIGTDAVTDILELRPFATEEPELLVNRIRNLIASVYYDRKRISVSGHRRALGGHIHISEVAPEASLVQMLDDFVGRYFVELSGDARGDFKELGQVAEKEHHGHGGFEYRTPPSAVFHNPRVTGIIMKLVKTLCEELRRGDIEYETDAAGRALPAEFEKRIGEDNARRLFEFVEMYNVQLRETRGTNTPIEIDVEGWRIPQSQIQLDMRDDWCEECREAVVDAINEVQQDPRFADCDARFMVFGMRADRGNRAYYFHERLDGVPENMTNVFIAQPDYRYHKQRDPREVQEECRAGKILGMSYDLRMDPDKADDAAAVVKAYLVAKLLEVPAAPPNGAAAGVVPEVFDDGQPAQRDDVPSPAVAPEQDDQFDYGREM